ncbi:hypothetical protein CP532_1676 [Ophiocordyceps camponoti-leonardi (nom. inval.)]|nr:hypothetical protein CP532_1676 [Ophiocordyceps camponoti-leonardi (nom. inval.)]
MTDLLRILPSFPVGAFSNLVATAEQHGLSTTDLLALHPVDIAKQTRLPVLDLRRFVAAIQASLADEIIVEELTLGKRRRRRTSTKEEEGGEQRGEKEEGKEEDDEEEEEKEKQEQEQESAASRDNHDEKTTTTRRCISTLDDDLDAALGGGIPLGCITEFAGESGAGKTQFLLSLCLSVQLPPPRGRGRQAVYISTEAGLATSRLAQMLASNEVLLGRDEGGDGDGDGHGGLRPSLDNIHATVTPDLESQEHILEYQVPVLLERHNVGIVVVDSVAANYRAEFHRGHDGGGTGGRAAGADMAARRADLVRLGALLRLLARRHDIAVVVANQVADRFDEVTPTPVFASSSSSTTTTASASAAIHPQESPLASRAPPPSSYPLPPPPSRPPPSALRLDHQQRWFTGWGDDPHAVDPAKTPSLGLVWSTQIACRVVLLKRPVYAPPPRRRLVDDDDDDDDADTTPSRTAWRRWMKVVFAPHAPASGQGLDGCLEFEVTKEGLKTVKASTTAS